MNNSANPNVYPRTPSLRVDCLKCGARETVFDRHDQTDAAIKRKHFPRWAVKGVFGARRTLCPDCR